MFEWTIVQEKTKVDTKTDTTDEDTGDDMEETDYASELEYDGVDDGEDTDAEPDTTGDDTTDDGTEADTSTEQDGNEARKNADLIADFINLTDFIKNTNKKIGDANFNNVRTNAIIAQVTKNLNLIYKQLFKYITQEFSSNTYIANLFKYNSYIELIKINIAMLKK